MKKTILLLLGLALILILSAYAFSGDELSRSQGKWQNANISHYKFELGVGCFCPVGDLMPLTVEVKDGEIVSITDVKGEPFTAENPMSEFILKYATIDRIFEQLATSEVKDADKVTISYDETYGFPVDVAIDFIELAADEELYLSVQGFEPLP